MNGLKNAADDQVLIFTRMEGNHREAAALSMNRASFTSRLLKPPQSCEVRVIWTCGWENSFSDLSRPAGETWVLQESICVSTFLSENWRVDI